MAECHPVGFQWVMEARERGAEVIHVDPRFTRTSAMATKHIGIRAGSDIAFLGGVVHYIFENERWFDEYVKNYTNAPAIITDDFADTEDLDGLFSGWDPKEHSYDQSQWKYKGAEIKEGKPPKGEQAGHGGGSVMNKGGDFRVVDIVTEGSSLTKNYFDQIHRTITDKGVPALLEKLRDRAHAL